MKKLIITAFCSILSLMAFSQTGTIRGNVIDDGTGEPIMFANILVEELGTGTTTDLDGVYTLDLDPGTYTFIFSYIGYSDLPVTEVIVEAGKIELMDIRLKEVSNLLEEVVVTARQMRDTEAALATIKQKSINAIDGVTSQSIKRTGDGDAGAALRRVTGVSVEGGKHVVVRGLGDRYTKTILNSVEIPGLDPDRNSVQMDLFPTNLIDNLIVYKTFSPDLPGDFTGGAVNIVTKDFPEKPTFSVSLSAAYNPNMHFKDNFLSYDRGKTDWIGIDDGTRALKFSKDLKIPDVVLKSPVTQAVGESFSESMAAVPMTNDLNKSISISGGNQLSLGKGTFGFIGALNYSNNYTHYDDVQFSEYFRNANNDNYFIDRNSSGTLSEIQNQWSAMGGMSYKKDNHKVSFQALHIQSGESKAAKLNQANFEFNSSLILRDNLEYYQRSITNLALTGNHVFKKGIFDIDWKLSPSLVNVDEPDIRTTGFDLTDGDPVIRPAVGADISRTWRYLDEINYNGRVDLTYNFKVKSRESKLKTGFYGTVKERQFEILNYTFRIRNQSDFAIQGNADNLFTDATTWTPESGTGLYTIGNFEPSNTFDARQQVMAGYVMHDLPLTKKLKITYGVRAEQAINHYTGVNNSGSKVFNNKEVLNSFNLLPSMNVLLEVAPKANLRLSANRTVARPSFKENSIAQIQDRINGRTFLGNIDLIPTRVNNFDLRFEKFLFGGQLFSASVFFKQFFDPIQLVVFDETTPSNFQPKNDEDTNVYGFEAEASKKLGFIAESLNKFSVSANYTLVRSDIPLIGLSPSIFNTSLSYTNSEKGMDAAVSYNVQGRRLSIVGSGRIEDVYEIPFPSLNFKIGKRFGVDQRYSVSFAVQNILDSVKQREYDTRNSELAIFDRYEPGRQFKLSLGYTIR